MPKGIKGFQSGNSWRFQLDNKFGKGGSRLGAGRPKYFSLKEKYFIRNAPLLLRKKTFWYVRRWFSSDLMKRRYCCRTLEDFRQHRILLRIYRRSYGGKSLARIKRFYANVRRSHSMR